MRRLKALLLCNNSVSKIGPNLGDNISRMQTIILTNNRVSNLFEIDHLSTVKTLEMLSLLENPVALKPNYRLYAIYRIPTLKCLDFSKVTKQERDDAARMFKSSAGKAFLNLVAQEKQMAANAAAKNGTATKPTIMELTDGQKEQVKQAIERATTKEQIDTIEYQLQVKSIVLSFLIFLTFVVSNFSYLSLLLRQTGTFPFADEEVKENSGNSILAEVASSTAAPNDDNMDLD